MAAPIVEAVAKDRAGRWVVLKINTDQAPEAGQQYDIMSIPTFVVFRGGAEAQRRSGISGKADLDSWLDRVDAGAR